MTEHLENLFKLYEQMIAEEKEQGILMDTFTDSIQISYYEEPLHHWSYVREEKRFDLKDGC